MTDIAAVCRAIDDQLPELARGVIRRHLDPRDPATEGFLARPDAREQHQTEWHQWGIITHTRMFLRHFDAEVPAYLQQWDLWDGVRGVLSERIDGATRWDLLHISILLHDIGKFAARTHHGGRFHFAHHESMSGAIIRQEIHLERYGLSPAQVEYIATTAEDHFVLGLLRKAARSQRMYDEKFVSDPNFVAMACRIKDAHPEDSVEIGVLFLGDSLAKVDPTHGPVRAVSQYDLNIALAHRYLDVIVDNYRVRDRDG